MSVTREELEAVQFARPGLGVVDCMETERRHRDRKGLECFVLL